MGERGLSEIASMYKVSKGEKAWRENLQNLSDAAATINSSLGPKGYYKMVVYNRGPEQVVKITKDPVPVLEELAMENSLVTVISEAAKMQRNEYGDGVKYFTILLSALISGSLELIDLGLHPNTIISGYRSAAKESLKYIDDISSSELDVEKIAELIDCGRDILNPGLRELLIKAYTKVKGEAFEKDRIRVIHKMGGKTDETSLLEGAIIKKDKLDAGMPDEIHDPRIAIITNNLSLKRLEVKMKGEGPTPFELNIRKPNDILAYKNGEDIIREKLLDPLEEHKIDVLVCCSLVDDKLKSKLARKGVIAFESVDRNEANELARASKGNMVSKLKYIQEEDIGSATRVYMDELPPEKIGVFEGCEGSTIITRSSTTQMKEDLDSLLSNYYRLLESLEEDYSCIPGDGVSEIMLHDHISKHSLEFKDRRQVAVQYFADALLEIPKNLADNYGHSRLEKIVDLKNKLSERKEITGIGLENPCLDLSVVKKSAIRRAFEVCELLLQIDTTMISKDLVKVHH